MRTIQLLCSKYIHLKYVCPVCLLRVYMIGFYKCGHVICLSCFKNMKRKPCCICREYTSFTPIVFRQNLKRCFKNRGFVSSDQIKFIFVKQNYGFLEYRRGCWRQNIFF